MKPLIEVLMDRDGMTKGEANDEITRVRDLLNQYLQNGEMCFAETICEDEFGLEPDYIMDLMW